MRVGGIHWMVALSAASLLHAGIAVALLWWPSDSGAVSAGVGGIEVLLGPAGGAPGSVAAMAADISEVATVAPSDVVEVRPIEVEETTVQQPAPAEAATPMEEQVARAVVLPPAPKRKPRPRDPAPEVATAEAAPASPVETPEPSPVQVAAIAPSAPGAGGKAGTQDNPTAGIANDISGGGMPGETADFMAQLQAWLEKHKEYPRRARMRRQEGTALLYFEMDRDGKVLRHRLQRSSGHDLLDREVLAMIERAQPLPKLPETMGEPRLELVVPVQFFLR